MNSEKTIKENLRFKGKILTVFNDDVLTAAGNTATREYIRHNGGVCVVAINENDEVYMVRQYRYPYKEEVLELPAGKLELGEDPLLAGIRELREETGLVAEKTEPLGEFYPSPGYTSEIIHMYKATGLKLVGQDLDEDEFLSVEKYPLEDLKRMILSGEIKDGKTIAAVSKVLLGDK
jgi:ADP-ribose pyrophosphatase